MRRHALGRLIEDFLSLLCLIGLLASLFVIAEMVSPNPHALHNVSYVHPVVHADDMRPTARKTYV